MSNDYSMFREAMVAMIQDAIERCERIGMTVETGKFSMSIQIMPDAVDVGATDLIIYAGDDVYEIDTEHVIKTNGEDTFYCTSDDDDHDNARYVVTIEAV